MNIHSKYKRSSLRSQCWMRLFLWFLNILLCEEQQMHKSRKNEEITAFNRKLVEWQKFREIHQLFLMKVCILDAALMRWWWEFLIWSILLEHFFQLDFGMRGFFFVSDHWRLLINKWWERKLKEVASLRLLPEKNSRCLIKCCQFYYLKLQCNALFHIRKRD